MEGPHCGPPFDFHCGRGGSNWRKRGGNRRFAMNGFEHPGMRCVQFERIPSMWPGATTNHGCGRGMGNCTRGCGHPGFGMDDFGSPTMWCGRFERGNPLEPGLGMHFECGRGGREGKGDGNGNEDRH